MSRFIAVLALMITCTAPFPSSASVFSHEFAGIPDLPTTPAERSARAIYPGPVQWIFGAPELEESGFVGFLKRLRGFFAADDSVSRTAVADAPGQDRDGQSGNAMYRDWDAPLPVTVTNANRQDIIEVFLGVNVQFFLNRLFSAALNINDDILTDRRKREREAWRGVFFGGGAGLTSSGGRSSGSSASGWSGGGLLSGGSLIAGGNRAYFPGEGGKETPGDKSVIVEVKEQVVDVLTHPLLVIGLIVALFFAVMEKLRGDVATN